MKRKNMIDEKRLLRQARQWDKDALVRIYDLYSPGLYRYAMRLLGNAGAAEECVAESFERFLSAVQRGGGPSQHLQAYLYRTAHNWVSDYYRRSGPPTQVLEQGLPADDDPGQSALDRMDREKLRKALARLTEEQRQVIALKYLEGMANKQVADIMKKSVGAVKALEQRGLGSLQRMLHTGELKIN